MVQHCTAFMFINIVYGKTIRLHSQNCAILGRFYVQFLMQTIHLKHCIILTVHCNSFIYLCYSIICFSYYVFILLSLSIIRLTLVIGHSFAFSSTTKKIGRAIRITLLSASQFGVCYLVRKLQQ